MDELCKYRTRTMLYVLLKSSSLEKSRAEFDRSPETNNHGEAGGGGRGGNEYVS